MDLSFWKMCPSGNTTILISEPRIAPELRAPLANILMHPLHLQAEQVAYVDMNANPPRINMMGGEFCGNACRSLAAMLAMSQESQACEGIMSSSGTDTPVPYRVTRAENNTKSGTVHAAIRMPNATMPLVTMVNIQGQAAPIIHLEGIDHLLLDAKIFPQSNYFHNSVEADAAVHALLAKHGLLESVAAGCIWYDYDEKAANCTIKPFVYVRETNSLYAETACGSGTLAVTLYLASMTQGQANHDVRDFTLDVMQPSGMAITATCSQQAEHIEAWIGGHVTCVAKGVTTVDIA